MKPKAPASIASRTVAFIRESSSSRGGRFLKPIASMRTVPCPTIGTKLVGMSKLSSSFRYSSKVRTAPGEHAFHRRLEGHISLEQVQGVGVDRSRRFAALPRALRRDALAEFEVPRIGGIEHVEVGVAVHVDKPRRDVKALRIDDPIGFPPESARLRRWSRP